MLAKKSLGQNWLKSPSALSAIVAAGDIQSSDIVLEIGPGQGALTTDLLKRAGKVIAIEKDRRLIDLLKEKFATDIEANKFDLIEADILDFDLAPLNFYDVPYKLIANIPYYITGQIIRKFLEAENQPKLMVLMLQKEVANRIVAGDKKESILSISVKVYGEPKYIKTVPRGAFSPAPNVDSAILLINNISKKNFVNVAEDKFFAILKQGFAQKRKKLISNLKLKPEQAKELEIDENARAEDLRLEQWLKLAKNL
ncbi:MAG: 16S rRNA (adenine(1518)-N(6)/adenine(1519)-N(6))-dimethyltransferase RsmA [bacterium]